jgi:hypothetical protein
VSPLTRKNAHTTWVQQVVPFDLKHHDQINDDTSIDNPFWVAFDSSNSGE